MARDRVLSGQQRLQDEPIDTAMRPQCVSEIVGQRAVMEKLAIAMEAAGKRGEPLEHLLLDGPPGLGKTTLANVIAKEMTGKPPRITSGPSLAKQADLMALLTNLETGDSSPAYCSGGVSLPCDGGLSGRLHDRGWSKRSCGQLRPEAIYPDRGDDESGVAEQRAS